MAYTITNSRGDVIAVVQSGQEDTSATSLTLLGANYPQYGLQQNENFVYLLENFADSTAPSNPVLGQLWYNSTTGVLAVYDINGDWVGLTTEAYVQAQKISPIFTGIPQAPTAANTTSSNQLATTLFVQNVIDSRNLAPLNSPVFLGTPAGPTAAPNNTATTQLATTEFVNRVFADTDLSLYATKNNAVLTGVPVAPTAPIATSNTQLATTAFVQNLFGSIDLSPYAPKVSPALTGVPTAPTAANTTANTQIATTAFVSSLFNSLDLSPYATKVSPTFTGIPVAPSPAASDNTAQIATAQFVQQQKISPAFTGTPTTPTAAPGTANTQIASTAFVAAALGSLTGLGTVDELAGSIKMWAGATPPANWALCDGSAVSRSLYPTLFARIGTTYGAGDGSTTFNLPNFTNRFGVGAGGAYARGATGGTADAVIPQHTHSASSTSTVNDPGHLHHVRNTANGADNNRPPGLWYWADRGIPPENQVDNEVSPATTGITVNTTTTVNPTGSSATNANLPPYIACFWIIKVSDDGSGGGTLQAGAGIDITTSGPFSTITNTGVRSLTAGTGITLSGSTGDITISSTGGGGGTADIAGAIKLWGGATEPTDWVYCDGRSLDRSAYPSLFARIGTAYGSSSSTTFNVPDFRGRFSLGSNTTYPRGAQGELGPFLTHPATTRRLIDFDYRDSYLVDSSYSVVDTDVNLDITMAPYTTFGGNGNWWTSSPATQPKPMPAPPITDPLETICVFGYPQMGPSPRFRFLTNSAPINLSASGATEIEFWVNRGTEATWGQIPDSTTEDLYFEYNTSFGSGRGPGWVQLARFGPSLPAGQWVRQVITLPANLLANAKNLKFRFRQSVEFSDETRSFVDTWAFTMPTVNADFPNSVPANDTSGELNFLSTPYIIKVNDNGTQRSGDGGGDTSRAGDVKWVAYGLNQYPPGWRTADGAAVSRTEFPALFARIGTTYGAGDGSTTFNLPDLRGRFSLSAIGSASTGTTRVNTQRGSVGGSTDSVVVSHSHGVNDPGHQHDEMYWNSPERPFVQSNGSGPAESGFFASSATAGNLPVVRTRSSGTGITINSAGESGSGKNVPPYTTLEAIIKMDDDSVNTGGILQAGPGISITTSGTYTTISNTVTQNPVVAGPGITVQNATGGALVSANVRNIISDSSSGIQVTNNNGVFTIGGGVGLGYNQSWQNFVSTFFTPSSQRQSNVNYTNTTGRPIMVVINWYRFNDINDPLVNLSVDGVIAAGFGAPTLSGRDPTLVAVVPPGSVYRLNSPFGTVVTQTYRLNWSELR